MRTFSIVFLFLYFSILSTAQVRIHAHNDYEKPVPLMNALSNRVFSVEADVFLRNEVLLVAHSASEITASRTLSSLYIQPIINLFKKYGGRISEDTNYKVTLVIDVKQGGEEAIRQIGQLVKPFDSIFDRSKNPLAVQLVISGDRGNINNWKQFPAFIFFDGRPYEEYDTITLQRVALISDGYAGYAKNNEKVHTVLQKAHKLGKLFRFWGTPDNESDWNYFYESGVDIINTDKPESCRKFFDAKK